MNFTHLVQELKLMQNFILLILFIRSQILKKFGLMLKSEPRLPNPGTLKIVNEKLDEAFCIISQKILALLWLYLNRHVYL